MGEAGAPSFGTALFESFMDPVAVVSPITGADGAIIDLRFDAVNDAAVEYLGRSQDLLLGHPVSLFTSETHLQEALTVSRSVLASGTTFQLDHSAPVSVLGGPERRFDFRLSRAGRRLIFTWRDVTERAERDEQLAASEAAYRLLAEQSADGVLRFELDGTITYASPACERLLDYSPEELVGTTVYSLMHPEDLIVAQEASGRVLEEGVVHDSIRARLQSKDGSYRWISSTGRTVTRADGTPVCVIASWRDASAEVAESQALLTQAATDDLTGLLTRRAGWSRLQSAVTEQRRSEGSLAVMFCDLDGFKAINDTYGHAVGDALLAEVSLRVLSCVRQDDYVVRLGGDELLVVLNDVRELGAVETIAEKLRAAIAEPMTLDGHRVVVTVSIGASLVRPDERVAELIQRADQAMYQAKSHGGDRVRVRA
jgi:diguanylate cyclase (GGDEF)-like protein/PAS domain S-box-containing protein